MVALNAILTIEVLRPRTRAFVNSRNGRTKTNAPKAMSLLTICAPVPRLTRVQAGKPRVLGLRCSP
jgi:hypothetical protein